MNDAITQMDQVTQQNAALVEEAAAAAESMQEQSAKLADVVSVFKLDASQMAMQARALPPALRPRRPAPAVRAPVRKALAAAPKPAVAASTKAEGWEEF